MTAIKRLLQSVKLRHVLIGILALQFTLGALYTFAIPLWRGHEQDFYTVVRFLAQNGRLPAASDYPNGDAEIRQATQPPLYFLIAYPIVALLDNNQPVPPGSQPTLVCTGDNSYNAPVLQYPITTAYQPPTEGTVTAAYGLRLLNVVIGMVATLLVFQAGRILFPKKVAVALVAAGLTAFEGNLVLQNSIISNDTLMFILSAANLLACAYLIQRFEWKWMLLLFISASLALLTHLSGWAIPIFDIFFLILIGVFQRRLPLRGMLVGAGVLLVAGIAVLTFNQLHFGSLLGRYSGLSDNISRALAHFQVPWVTIAGIANFTYGAYQEPLQFLEPRAILGRLYGFILVIGIIGITWAVIRAVRKRDSIIIYVMLFAMMAFAILLVIFRNTLVATDANTTFYNTSLIFAPVRYYAPGIPAAMILLSAGLLSLVPERWQRLNEWNLPGIGLTVCWLIVIVAGGIKTLADEPITIVSPAAFAAISGMNTVSSPQPANFPQIRGYTMQERPADGLVDLNLYLQTDLPLANNDFVEVSMIGDHLLNSCQFLPAHGAYPTNVWQPGQIVVAHAELPNCSAWSEKPVQLSLIWRSADQKGQILAQDSSPPIALATLTQPLLMAPSCPDNLGVIAQGYQVVKFNSPESVSRSEAYLPSVNWIVLNADPNAVTRVFSFTHEGDSKMYTCVGTSEPQMYTVTTWQRGQTIYFDGCDMHFPADAPAGTYHVTVSLVDVSGKPLPAADAAGQALLNGQVPVGEVQLES